MSERAPLPSTIGDRSIRRYADGKNEPIIEESSQIERSFMHPSNRPNPQNINVYQ